MLEAQTADISLPGDRKRLELIRDWADGEDFIEAADAGAAASFDFRAGGAFAALSGGGLLQPGLYETDGIGRRGVSRASRRTGWQFTPEG